MINNDFREVNHRRRRHLGRDITKARSIDDLRERARRRLPNFLYEYLEGGAEDERTLRENRAAFSRCRFLPYAMRDVSERSLERSIFGRKAAMPVVISPTGFAGFFWPEGDTCLAAAAAAAGVPMTQSTVSNADAKQVASTPNLRHWFQLYMWGSPEVTETLIGRAVDNGSEALVVTIDGAVSGHREWDQRNYRRPGKLSVASLLDVARHPSWLLATLKRGKWPNFENLLGFVGTPNPTIQQVADWIGANHNAALTWADIVRLRHLWPRKLIVKGILRPDDAMHAIEAGADGLVVSNHGGRQAEPAVTPLEMLPLIRERIGDGATLFIDSGFRRGSDIAMALALGADAVFLGRATLYGLAAGGEAGVGRALGILRDELDRVLALIGVPTIEALTPDVLMRARL